MICKVCRFEREHFTLSTVDVFDNARIFCCVECAAMLLQATHYQYYGNLPRKWANYNAIKLDRAFNLLFAQRKKHFDKP